MEEGGRALGDTDSEQPDATILISASLQQTLFVAEIETGRYTARFSRRAPPEWKIGFFWRPEHLLMALIALEIVAESSDFAAASLHGSPASYQFGGAAKTFHMFWYLSHAWMLGNSHMN